ncbi:MAG: hypothetical protein AAF399_26605 [Bacteroidota bacterium]
MKSVLIPSFFVLWMICLLTAVFSQTRITIEVPTYLPDSSMQVNPRPRMASPHQQRSLLLLLRRQERCQRIRFTPIISPWG